MLDEAAAEALKQVRFAEAATAVDEEGVVLRAGEFCDVECGVVSELIALADDEGFDFVSEARFGGLRRGAIVMDDHRRRLRHHGDGFAVGIVGGGLGRKIDVGARARAMGVLSGLAAMS